MNICEVCALDADDWQWCSSDDPRCPLPKPVVQVAQTDPHHQP